MHIRIELRGAADSFDYHEYQRIQQALTEPLEHHPAVLLLKKDVEELVLILKGSSPEYLHEHKLLLLQVIQHKAQAVGGSA